MKHAILKMSGVARTFAQGGETIVALKPTDFVVNEGEFVAIVGPSGSGKSTFLTIAGALQTPSEGAVSIDGKETAGLTAKALSELRLGRVGFILQASNLVPYLRVKDQLKLIDVVLKRKSNPKAMAALYKELSIDQLVNKYPSDLSGGERQRAAIAKVLYGKSKLILADEPTASLDTEKAFDVVKLLAQETHNRKKATIMVTHDTRLLEFCDHVYEMKDGTLTKQR